MMATGNAARDEGTGTQQIADVIRWVEKQGFHNIADALRRASQKSWINMPIVAISPRTRA